MEFTQNKLAAAFLLTAGLAGCSNVSPEQSGLIGAGVGYVGAKEAGASDEVAVLAGIAGLVIGQNTANPCRTQTSGRVVETQGTYGYNRQQTQATAYKCQKVGAPAGAAAPTFK